mmetsp:Transcript_19235/g.35383  ORF Transcript_19235/g.35383 Transcript_19235/m.35383 type:complete len:313 (+) Transcript_19235:33-971(+)
MIVRFGLPCCGSKNLENRTMEPLPTDDDDARRQRVAASASTIRDYLRGNRKRDIAKDVAIATAMGSLQLAKELTTKREDGVLPKAVSDFIQKIEVGKGETIERMVVVRTPVEAYVGKLMHIVSLGKYRDVISESYYDKMFHLSLLINGRYVLQKNEVIALTDPGGPPKSIGKGSEVMRVKIPPCEEDDATPLTFSLLLERTKQYMGPHAFSDYCAKTNNCQDFILAVLQSNGLAYPHLISFIKQDSENIFNQLPIHTTPVARALTNIAAVGDKLMEDITVKHQKTDYESLITNVSEWGETGLELAGSYHKRK